MLHIVSRYRLLESLPGILKRTSQVGTNVNTQDEDGRTALSYAAEYGHEARVSELLAATRAGIIERVIAVVPLLLEKGPNLDIKDKSGQTPLLWAARKRHKVIVQLLLENGACINTIDNLGWTPLSLAVGKRLSSTTEGRISRAIRIRRSRHRMRVTGREDQDAVVCLLLEQGTRVDAKDMSGRTPLSWAAEKGHEAAIQHLVKNGASINADDHLGQTPLSLAATNGHDGTVQLLQGALP